MAVQFNMHMPPFNPDMGVDLNAAPTWKLELLLRYRYRRQGG